MAKRYTSTILLGILLILSVIFTFVVKVQTTNLYYTSRNDSRTLNTYTTSTKSSESSSSSDKSTSSSVEDLRPKIAFTFDADMTPYMKKELETGKIASWYDKELIDLLIKENVEATIFITGLWAESYPTVTKELSDNPLFEIGSHSYKHYSFTKDCYGLPYLKDSEKEDDLTKSVSTLKYITGKEVTLFRFPGGCRNKSDQDLVTRLGLKEVYWTLVSGDAFNKNENNIYSNVIKKAKANDIIVMHLNGATSSPKTYEAMVKIIPYLKEKEFRFVKISEL
jgi:peptidoglycan/xylan/chitin deacetylase (PgdA/CDA1 family)